MTPQELFAQAKAKLHLDLYLDELGMQTNEVTGAVMTLGNTVRNVLSMTDDEISDYDVDELKSIMSQARDATDELVGTLDVFESVVKELEREIEEGGIAVRTLGPEETLRRQGMDEAMIRSLLAQSQT